MVRFILWALLALFLMLVGAFPAAAAPVALAMSGAGVVVGKIPGVALIAIAAIAYLRRRPTPAPATA